MMYQKENHAHATRNVKCMRGVYVCCAEGGCGGGEGGRKRWWEGGGQSTHLFEQFYFGAQSLDGLVVLAFEIIREACA